MTLLFDADPGIVSQRISTVTCSKPQTIQQIIFLSMSKTLVPQKEICCLVESLSELAMGKENHIYMTLWRKQRVGDQQCTQMNNKSQIL